MDVIEPASPATGSSLTYRVFFNGNVASATPADFAPLVTGTALAQVSSVQRVEYNGIGTEFLVHLDVSGDGTMILGLSDENTINIAEFTTAVENVIPSDPVIIENNSPYSDWAATNYPGETDSNIIGFNATSQDNGIPNAISFLTASDPTTYDPNSRATVTLTGATLSHTMRRNSAVMTAFIEYSLDMNEWFAVDDVTGITVTETPDAFGTGVDQITVEVDTSIHGECFIRQGITAP